MDAIDANSNTIITIPFNVFVFTVVYDWERKRWKFGWEYSVLL